MIIEIQTKTSKTSGYAFGHIVIDGKVYEDTHVDGYSSSELPHVRVSDLNTSRILSSCSPRKLSKHFSEAMLIIPARYEKYINRVELKLNTEQNPDHRIDYPFDLDLSNWAKPFSGAELANAIKQESLRADSDFGYHELDDFMGLYFSLSAKIEDPDMSVEELLDSQVGAVNSLVNSALTTLAKNSRKGSLVTFFDFPPGVKTACEQYLIYFVQFLEDLGIKANGELKEDTQKVLFSITPQGGDEALARIREALDMYLKLPGMPDFDIQVTSRSDIAVLHLQANVHHLKSQLVLSNAIIKAKDATIDALELTTYQYNQLLSAKQSKVESDEKDIPESTDYPLIGDTVSLGKYEGKLIKVDVPKLARRLPELLKSLKRFVGK